MQPRLRINALVLQTWTVYYIAFDVKNTMDIKRTEAKFLTLRHLQVSQRDVNRHVFINGHVQYTELSGRY